MANRSKAEAQRRADDIARFREELARLGEEGVLALDAAQRERVEAHHRQLLAALSQDFDIDRDARARQLSLGMKVVSFLGALALSAAVFFLFSQFWGLLGTAAQVAILIGTSITTLALTEFIHRRDASGYFAKLAALVAFSCFVINIALFGQIFNMTPTDRALLPWAAYALLLAYRCELRLLLVAGILCIAGYLAARTGAWGGIYWLHFGERPENFFPAALLVFGVPLLADHSRYPGFAATWRISGLLGLLIPMLILGHWGGASYLDWRMAEVEFFYQTLGFLTAAAAIALGVRRGWGDTSNTGTVFFVLFLYTKFFDWWWEWLPKWLFFLLIALSAVLLLLVFQRLRRLGTSAPIGETGGSA